MGSCNFLGSGRSSSHLNLFTENFWDNAQPYKLVTSQHLRYEDPSFFS